MFLFLFLFLFLSLLVNDYILIYLKTTILYIYNFLILYECLFRIFFFSLYSSLASLKSWVRPCQQQIAPNSKFCMVLGTNNYRIKSWTWFRSNILVYWIQSNSNTYQKINKRHYFNKCSTTLNLSLYYQENTICLQLHYKWEWPQLHYLQKQ